MNSPKPTVEKEISFENPKLVEEEKVPHQELPLLKEHLEEASKKQDHSAEDSMPDASEEQSDSGTENQEETEKAVKTA